MNIYAGTYRPSRFHNMFVYYAFRFLWYLSMGWEYFFNDDIETSLEMSAFRKVLRWGKYIMTNPELSTIRQPFLSIMTSGFRTDRVFMDAGVWSGWDYQYTSSRAVFYIHGGGYVSGDIAGYLAMVDKIATVMQCPVFLPQYRLVPEHSLDDIIKDLVESVEHVRERFPVSNLCVMGDSAGGGLALRLLEWYAQRDEAPFQGCVLLSPMVDLNLSGSSIQTNVENDTFLELSCLEYCASLTLNTVSDYQPWQFSWDKFPPLYVSVSEDELLLSDSLYIGEHSPKASVYVFPKRFHAYPIFWEYIPESEAEFYHIDDFWKEIN